MHSCPNITVTKIGKKYECMMTKVQLLFWPLSLHGVDDEFHSNQTGIVLAHFFDELKTRSIYGISIKEQLLYNRNIMNK